MVLQTLKSTAADKLSQQEFITYTEFILSYLIYP